MRETKNKTPRKRGRPPAKKASLKAEHVNARITGELRAKLASAASARGRTLSQEIAIRLQQSFLAVDLPGETRQTRALSVLAADAITRVEALTGKFWFDDLFTFREAMNALKIISEAFQPPGDGSAPASFPVVPYLPEPLRLEIAKQLSLEGVGASVGREVLVDIHQSTDDGHQTKIAKPAVTFARNVLGELFMVGAPWMSRSKKTGEKIEDAARKSTKRKEGKK